MLIFVFKEGNHKYVLNNCTASGQQLVGSDDFCLALCILSMHIILCTFFKSINEVETIQDLWCQMCCLDCVSSSCQGKEKGDKELLVKQFPGLPIFLACKKVHFNLTLVTNECLA